MPLNMRLPPESRLLNPEFVVVLQEGQRQERQGDETETGEQIN
jgi:hypothetical protein